MTDAFFDNSILITKPLLKFLLCCTALQGSCTHYTSASLSISRHPLEQKAANRKILKCQKFMYIRRYLHVLYLGLAYN